MRLDLDKDTAAVLFAVLNNVGGSENGPRGKLTSMREQLEAEFGYYSLLKTMRGLGQHTGAMWFTSQPDETKPDGFELATGYADA